MLNSFERPNPDKRTAIELPHNIEAEQSLLGAILLDNRAFERVSEIVGPNDFFDPLHGRIFAAASLVIQEGQLVSPVRLKTFFEREPLINGVTTVTQYLGSLIRVATTVSGAPDYARTIRELADRRALILIGHDLATEAGEASADKAAAGIVEDAEARLFALAERNTDRGGVLSFRQATTLAVERAKTAKKFGFSGLSTGISDLDAKLGGLQKTDLIILAGRPSMGKTALATNIAYNVAKHGCADENGEFRPAPVGFFSCEMSSEQLATRILSAQAEISGSKILRGHVNQEEFERLDKVATELSSLPIFIDDRGGLTIGQVMARARRMKRQHGLALLIVDYLQLLSGTKKERVQELTQITTGLKALAKELGIPIIALSQLSRANEKREDKRPQLSDLRESGSIEQDADVVMFVFREEYYIEREKPDVCDQQKFRDWQKKMLAAAGKAEAIIGKQRHGPVGIVELAFQSELTRFSDLARRDAS
jgi:replicative DNA helicase